jgi:predicted metal-dependent hydrolase
MDYKIRINKRAKRISLTVKRDGSCVVTVPFRRSSIFQNLLIKKAEYFVSTKKEWIEVQKEKYRKLHEKIRIMRGMTVVRDGESDVNAKSLPESQPASKLSEKELKAKTLAIVEERLVHFNQFYNFAYKDVRVKKVSTRWGSCSRRGNLNFSHKLALLLPDEVDYVVVHELCHLAEFNHGPKFWKLVEQTIPNYMQIRKGMRFAIF